MDRSRVCVFDIESKRREEMLVIAFAEANFAALRFLEPQSTYPDVLPIPLIALLPLIERWLLSLLAGGR
jgi:hypothetical protein